MSEQEFTYRTIDGREFIQRRLVLAQLEQMIDRLDGVKWPKFEGFNLLSFYEAIGTKLPEALAVALTEKEKNIRDKDLDALADDLRYSLPIEEGIRALKDFFTLNPTASIAQNVMAIVMGPGKTVGTAKSIEEKTSPGRETGSPTSL